VRQTTLLSIYAAMAIACAKPVAPGGAPPIVDPSVSKVLTFGLWEDGGQEGQLRLVVTTACPTEHCVTRAYLEWLAPDAVAHSVRVAELGDFAVVQDITRVPTRSQPNRLELGAVNTYTMEETRFCLVAGVEPGRYTAEESPCPAAE
jgi:hypothetical protein